MVIFPIYPNWKKSPAFGNVMTLAKAGKFYDGVYGEMLYPFSNLNEIWDMRRTVVRASTIRKQVNSNTREVHVHVM